MAADLAVTEGTIYPILGRLTRDGMLEAEWHASAAHPRKYYRLTSAGRRRVAAMVVEWRTFGGKIDRLVQAAERGDAT
jgi:PadR family transcriptional regulator PadR